MCPGGAQNSGWAPRSGLARLASAVALSSGGSRAACSRRGFVRVAARLRRRRWTTVLASSGEDEAWVKATGVPVLGELSKCGSLRDAGMAALQALGRIGTATAFASAALCLADRKFSGTKAAYKPGSAAADVAATEESRSRNSSSSGGDGGVDGGRLLVRARRALLTSLLHQAKRLLPWWSAASSATVACALLQVALRRRRHVLVGLLGSRGTAVALSRLRLFTQFLQDAAEEVLVALWAFTLMDAKGGVVATAQRWLCSAGDHTAKDAAGLVAAGSMLADAVILGTAAMFTLANYGVNLQPLLASLGASSIVAGLAAQSLLRNLVAGVTLYASRPFSVGDRVVFYSVDGCSVACQGTVVAVFPMQTEVAGDESKRGARDGGIFYLRNGDIMEKMIVHNTSRVPPPPEQATLVAAAGVVGLSSTSS